MSYPPPGGPPEHHQPPQPGEPAEPTVPYPTSAAPGADATAQHGSGEQPTAPHVPGPPSDPTLAYPAGTEPGRVGATPDQPSTTQPPTTAFEQSGPTAAFGQPGDTSPFAQPAPTAPFGHSGDNAPFTQTAPTAPYGYSGDTSPFAEPAPYGDSAPSTQTAPTAPYGYSGDTSPFGQPAPFGQSGGSMPYGGPGAVPPGLEAGHGSPAAYPPPVEGYQPAGAYGPGAGYPAAPYPYPGGRGTNGLAIASLVCSLAGLVTCISAPVGIVLGHVARRQIRESGEEGGSMATAGLVIGYIFTGLGLLLLGFYVVVGVLLATHSTSP